MSTKFEPLDENKKYEKIVALLKQRVFSGEFRPGDRLPTERELADALKVSRLTIREAYHALQMYGVIEIRRGHQGGAFICSPSNRSVVQSISDLFRFQGITIEEWTEARLILELDIARLAIRRAKKSDLERMEQVIDEAYEKSRNKELAHAENIRFHLCLAEIARNKILYTSYSSMMDLLLSSFIALGVGSDHYRSVVEEHRCLLDILKERDVELYLKTVEKHVKRAGENLIKIAKRSPLFNGTMT